MKQTRMAAGTALSLALALALAAPVAAQEEPPLEAPSPNAIVAQADASQWRAIPAEDLLVMTLAPDRDGRVREVVLQLMPAPFSQGWVDNVRILARAGWYDGVTVNRVQDNYVVQWGDPNYDNPEATGPAKPLPEGLRVMDESAYTVDGDALSMIPTEPYKRAAEIAAIEAEAAALERVVTNPAASEADHEMALDRLLSAVGLKPSGEPSSAETIAMISIATTQAPGAPEGWHERDSYAHWVEFWKGWPLANLHVAQWYDENDREIPKPDMPRHDARALGHYSEVTQNTFWPVHCYGMVGVGRGMSPDTGSGAELYTVIGHAPRHLDRNIALVGRVIAGMEHLSGLPRGSGDLGFYTAEEADRRTPIRSVRVAADLPESERNEYEYLATDGESFARYAEARANRRDPFFIVPAGGADICNIPVPVRRVAAD